LHHLCARRAGAVRASVDRVVAVGVFRVRRARSTSLWFGANRFGAAVRRNDDATDLRDLFIDV
jgi:hypothetical protein